MRWSECKTYICCIELQQAMSLDVHSGSSFQTHHWAHAKRTNLGLALIQEDQLFPTCEWDIKLVHDNTLPRTPTVLRRLSNPTSPNNTHTHNHKS